MNFSALQLIIKSIIYLFIISIITAFAGITYTRNMVWHNPLGLWRDTANKSPNSARANYNLGLSYIGHKDMKNAFYYMRKAKQIDPLYIDKWLKDEARK
mgnify:CR=1 FL=1